MCYAVRTGMNRFAALDGARYRIRVVSVLQLRYLDGAAARFGVISDHY